jgi:hypothetical protein
MKRAFAIAGGAFALALATPVAAAPAKTCPAGQELVVLRISTLKPTGSRAGFEEAARDHLKWYRDHGFKDNQQMVLDVFDFDQKTGATTVSKTKVMTIHYNMPDPKLIKRDAAWNAYVAKYRANSDIGTEELVCLPDRLK